MLPAGVIERVDEDDEKVWVNRTKEQIKDSPEYDVSKSLGWRATTTRSVATTAPAASEPRHRCASLAR